MKLTVCVIGDEILIGQVTDTNSGAISRTFGPYGWEVRKIVVIGDDKEQIRNAIECALIDSDLVITTGGLGPTKDDITKATLCEIFGGKMIYDESVAENIRNIFERRGLQLNELTRAQAIVPSSCRVIQNRFGTAPIMMFERKGKVLVAMPGVPFETEGSLPEVLKTVNYIFTPDSIFHHHTLIVAGISESALAERLDTYEKCLPPELHLAYLPKPGTIRLRLDGRNISVAAFNQALFRLKEELGALLINDGDASPAEIVIDRLRQLELTLATAESCTGGNIAHLITSVPGSSDVFLGSIVSYANEVKHKILEVNINDLKTHGAVSREVVEQMALGVCKTVGANCAVATSGIAGPGGGSDEKPVGTVWIAWCVKDKVESRLFRFPGSRERVIDRASTEALLALLNAL